MAIYGKFEVRIRINGQPVDEYHAAQANDSPHTPKDSLQINRLIESIPDTHYDIEVITHSGYRFPQCGTWDVVAFYLEIDGMKMGKNINFADDYKRCDYYGDFFKGSEFSVNGRSSVRCFRFQRYTGNNTFRPNSDMLHSRQLGIIKVCVTREKSVGPCRESNIAERKLESNSVPESLLKGRDVDTVTSLGVVMQGGYSLAMDTQKHDANPIVTFSFQYASRSVLESRGVLPLPDTPEAPQLRKDNLDATHSALLGGNRQPDIKVEDNEKILEQQRRENQRAKNLKQLRGLTDPKRPRSPSPLFFGDHDDGEIQEIKRPRIETEVEVIVLDNEDSNR